MMKRIGYFAWILLIISGAQPVLGNHNDSARALWDEVYSEYVCNTLDGYLWLADACTFPVRKALDYYIRYGDNTNGLYDHADQSFNNVPLLTITNDTLETYLYDYESIFGDNTPYDFSEDKICNDYMTLARDCMVHYFTNCSNTLSNDIEGYMTSYKNQYCESTDVLREYIQMQKGVFNEFLTGDTRRARCSGLSDFYDRLVDQTVCTEDLVLDSPYAQSDQNITDYVEQEPDDFLTASDAYTTSMRSAFRCMESEMRSLQCPTSEAQSLVVFMYSYMMPPGVDFSLQDAASIFALPGEESSLTTGDEADKTRSTSGMFGNGHLMAYGRTDNLDRQVCDMRRRWYDLGINKYIQLKGLPAFETATNYGAVYLSSIELIMLDGSGTELIEYSTSGSTLSTDVTIVDSKTQVVDSASDVYLALEEVSSGMIEITNPLGDVAVTISQYNGVYAVWVRMYDDDWDRTYGVLTDGCDNEIDQINILGYDPTANSGRRRRRRRSVSDVCQDGCDANVQDSDFVPCCELDCTVNGENIDQATGNTDMATESYTTTAESDGALVSNLRSPAPALRPSHCTSITALMLIFLTYLLSKM